MYIDVQKMDLQKMKRKKYTQQLFDNNSTDRILKDKNTPTQKTWPL